MEKSSVDEIRLRFDSDVDRFSNLETGQVSTVDALLSLQIITEAARCLVPGARDLLDVGCGAGNYTLRMLSEIPDLNCTLLDLSLPMLTRAVERITPRTSGVIRSIQGDIREVELGASCYDIILSGAALHHLRTDAEWESVFARLYASLRVGGCLLISDLITQESSVLESYFMRRYTSYLTGIGGAAYASTVLSYIEREDTPRSLVWQLDLLRRVGFSQVDVLHKHICFASYVGIK
jgi:tRNA (cmo5U34)-methyltransferase